MADLEELNELERQLDGLELSLARSSDVAQSFQRGLGVLNADLAQAERESAKFSNSLSSGLRRAFGDLIFEGGKLSDVMRSVAQSMIQTAFNAAITPVTDAVSSAVTSGLSSFIGGLLPFEKGGAVAQGRVVPFAKGGVVGAPTHFPMRGGVGLMGEAGPEAIMPLTRGADGSLGVRSENSAQPITITMNISTPDAASFQRSRAQVAANITRAIRSGQKNL